MEKNTTGLTAAPEGISESIQIKIASTPQEKREVYQLRYKVYVEEMSKEQIIVDHENKMIYDDLDEWGILIYAQMGSQIVGTARLNIGYLGDYPSDLVECLSMKEFQSCRDGEDEHLFSYASKLMIDEKYRGSSILYFILAEFYKISYPKQVLFGFTDCNVHLIRLYEQMGFNRYGKNFTDKGYGLLVPVVMIVRDFQHLREVRSPLYRITRKLKADNPQSVAWFHQRFMAKETLNSQLLSKEALWARIVGLIDASPLEVMPALAGLSEAEAQTFFHACGSLVECEAGDMFTLQGEVSYSYNILLSGKFKSLTIVNPIREFDKPGQVIGVNGLTEHNIHIENIAAVTSVKVLVLTGIAFPKFSHAHFETAHKIVRNILALQRNALPK